MRIRKELGTNNTIEVIHILYSKNDTIAHNYIQLTPRGKDVFSLIITGKTNEEIAKELGISKSGVRRHKEKMLLQNNCNTILELISKYYNISNNSL